MVLLLLVVVPAFVLYYVIRLAVRSASRAHRQALRGGEFEQTDRYPNM